MADDRRESVLALQELEPSPVEETPSGSKESYFPGTQEVGNSARSKGTNTLGLSGGHSSIWWLSRIQKYSSYAFSAFG